MRYKRSLRVQELLLEEISKLLTHGLKDPRIGFVTLTRVELSDNLKHARVMVRIMGDIERKEESMTGLNSAKGFIRGQLGRSLHLRYIPELEFKIDKSAEHVEKITKILSELHHEP